MKGCIPSVTAYTDNIVCDAVFLNPVPYTKYQITPMDKLNGLPTIIMMKVDKKKVAEEVQQKEVEIFWILRIRNDNIDELLEEILRRDKFDAEFEIEDGIDKSEDVNGY